MNQWKVIRSGKMPKLTDPVLLEGLPGIGNVGKITVDFLVDQLDAQKLCEFASYSFPHSVFVNEDNLVELPSIELYLKKRKGKNDLLFLVGDVQPIDEQSCYEFSELVLELLQKMGGNKIITLGGIGLKEIPEKPKVYATGCVKKHVAEFLKGTNATNNLYGTVGPIVGVTGILLGLGGRRKMKAIGLLSETFGHPAYLGLKGAKEMLAVLKKKLALPINLKHIDREIAVVEGEIRRRTAEIQDIMDIPSLHDLPEGKRESRYIG